MRKKLENWLRGAKLWKVYFLMLLIMTSMIFTIFASFELLIPGSLNNQMGTSEILSRAFYMSIIMGLLFAGLPTLMISTARQAEEFFKVAKPLMERSEKCTTKDEWNSVKNDLTDFNKNHKLGSFNNTYLNSIVEVLRVKKQFMK